MRFTVINLQVVLNLLSYFTISKLVDGMWSQWSQWATCCGGTQQSRMRTCTNPAPSNGGADCVGDDKQKRPVGEILG